MSYIEQFEAELVKKLQSAEDPAAIVRWVSEKVLESYRNGSLALVQQKLNKLTRGYLDEVIDEESYQAATKDLMLEKITLKKEKERVQRTRASAWLEPAKRVISTLEMATKAQS